MYSLINAYLPSFVHYFFIFIGFMAISPFFSHASVNSKAKMAICLGLGILLAMASPKDRLPETHNTIDLAVRAGVSFGIGFYVGAVFAASLEVIRFCGTIIGLSSQLGFAMMVDSNTGAQNNVIDRLVYYFGCLILLSGGAVDAMISAAASAPTTINLSKAWLVDFVSWSSHLFLFALFLAAPIAITALLVNIGMAFITKTAPSMNIFSIGFPLVLITVMTALLFYTPNMMTAFKYYFFTMSDMAPI